MDIGLIARLLPHFLQAAGLTLLISALALALGLTVAAGIAAARLSPSRVLRLLGAAYVSLVRGTPCLIQLFLIYFGGPQVGITLGPFAAGVIGLGLNIAAYMAEAIRGAILAVDRGQSEAARSLGFSRGQAMRRVILPQAARLMIRPLGVNAIALVKGSSLVATISVVELTYTAQRLIGSTFRPFEVFGIAALLYLVIIHALRRGIDRLDRAYAPG